MTTDTHTQALEKIAGFTLSQFRGPYAMAMECVNVAIAALAAAEAQPVATLTVEQQHLLQDCDKGLTAALAGKPDAMRHAREAAAAIVVKLQPLPAPPEPITLDDVLDALNVFNTPSPSEGGEPWTADDFIKVSFLPAFLTVCYAAWFAAPAAPAPALVPLTDEQIDEEWFEVHHLSINNVAKARLFARAIERAHGIGGEA